MKAAFLVGISEYADLHHLSACAEDVSIIESLIKATDKYERVEVVKKNTNSDVVKSALRNFAKELKEQDKSIEEFFIYFSGHGLQKNNEVFLCCSDYDNKRPESTSLLNSELDELIRTIDPELTVKVFDACQSGFQYIKDTNIFTNNWKGQSGINKFILMASCLQQESSFANQNISFFTKAFFEAAISKNIDDDIYYRDIQSYIADYFNNKAEQTPLFVTQVEGLETLGTTNSKIKELQLQHKNLIQEKIKLKSLPDRVLEAVKEKEKYFVSQEKVNNWLSQIETSKLELSLNETINRELYNIKSIDSVSFKDINCEKVLANKIFGTKWSNDCFVTIQYESYKVRQIREDLSLLSSFEVTQSRILGKALGNDFYETVTKSRPVGIQIDYPLPFNCLRLDLQPNKSCLHPWNSFLILFPARTYCVLALGFVKLDRQSWDKFKLDSYKIEWLWQELLWRDWEEKSPIKILISETEKRLKQDILRISEITLDEEFESDSEEC